MERRPAPQALLDALDPEQRAVAEALRGPVRVLAGAGTGKTRAITHRIAHGVATGVYAPSEVLAVTFTTRAAGEMRQRLRALGAPGVQARTFHSAALRQLRYFWPRVHGTELPQLVESKLGILGPAARRLRIDTDISVLRDLAAEVEWSKVSNVPPEEYARIAPTRGRSVANLAPAEVARVLVAYEETKRSQDRMDMEDVLLWTAGLLADDERVAAEVRRQYRTFVVDEFQDVSPLQYALLDLWLGGRDEICVVGDPAQTIYSFAGADPSYLRDFTRRHRDATAVELVRNYRSTPQIVEAANQLLAGTTSQGVRLRAQAAAGPEISAHGRPDEVDEAEAVAAAIAGLRARGVRLAEIAVLFRINAQSEAFEEALAARSVPYVVRGAARFFERPEVRQAITLVRGAARAGDGDSGDTGGGLVERVRGVLAGMGWSPEPPAARGQARDRWESLQALLDLAAAFAASSGEAAGLGAFVDDLDRRAAEQHAPVAEGVTLATMHAAKGLEWDAVFVCGLHDGTMPITYAEGPAQIEEERRLLYVALTRARRELHLSWAAARQPGGRGHRKPSRFLRPIAPDAFVAQESGTRAERKRGSSGRAVHCRTCGSPLSTAAEKKTGRCADCPAPYDEEVFERLRAWRREQAGADSVPAYVICTDATLALVAERMPRDLDALRKVSGIGPGRADKYGAQILAVVKGEDPAQMK